MNLPAPTEVVHLSRLLPNFDEMLRYCIQTVLECGQNGNMSYEAADDTVTYHLKLNSIDLELFPILHGIEEIWITTHTRRES